MPSVWSADLTGPSGARTRKWWRGKCFRELQLTASQQDVVTETLNARDESVGAIVVSVMEKVSELSEMMASDSDIDTSRVTALLQVLDELCGEIHTVEAMTLGRIEGELTVLQNAIGSTGAPMANSQNECENY